MTPLRHDDATLVVNLYPDRPRDPATWRSEDTGAPTVLFRRGPAGWVALFDRDAVSRAATPEALAADVYGQFGLLAVLHPEPLQAAVA